MKRRQLIKNLGLGGVALVATPTVLSLLQSCKSEPVFETVFVNQQQGRALRHIVDLIIPSDESVPGAIDVGVHNFIDMYWNDVLEEEDKPQIKLGFDALANRLEDLTGKTFENANAEDFDQVLAKYLMATPEQAAAYEKNLGSFYQTYAKDKSTIPDPDAASFSLLGNLRGMTLWAWKTSEEIGENVLAYDPIPGQQIGCLPVQGATGGKAYSL
ncbi:gluconate 2-dehydrogenase subunit 3 family protein [Dokdonia sp. Hel_I_53]|uniref:gluconate 2-dehydrogenase subunit 3 family protein n=1 Tax=Dokdonia sp. Hel_I_53 TaxID=1566287 RepID=UPI00119A2A3E|nr:gluconate 2-dehydrogenase subunit 3 family protein [Dokdonia sp. Hel_I_53]TVZ52759.1 gluconate 2-dehydrogenase subunit 3-like protein [Dokdonia sp. Hel_I_53]